MAEGLFTIIQDLAEAKTAAALEAILRRHPVLLAQASDQRLTAAIAKCQVQNKPQSAAVLLAVRAFLAGCRTAGLPGALQRISQLPLSQDCPMPALTQAGLPPAQRLELARRALHELRRESEPRWWAAVQSLYADALAALTTGERAQNLLEAAGHAEEARLAWRELAARQEEIETLGALDQIWHAYAMLDPARHMAAAIEACTRLLPLAEAKELAEARATLQHTLGNLYGQWPGGDRAANIELAIGHYSQALAQRVSTRAAEPRAWAITQAGLANAYVERREGDPGENVEQALRGYWTILQFCRRQAGGALKEMSAETHYNLAVAYRQRFLGRRPQNIERAIRHVQAALRLSPGSQAEEDISRAMVLGEQATLYSHRLRGRRAENLEAALLSYQAALEACPRLANPAYWARLQSNLANAYADRLQGELQQNLAEAIRRYRLALEVRTREDYPRLWAETHNNLGTVYADRWQRDSQRDDFEQAGACYRAALEVRTCQTLPAECRQTARNLGNLCFAAGAWRQAAEAFGLAIEADGVLYQMALLRSSKEALIAQAGDIYLLAAYALARAGDLPAALEALEQGRARLLGEALQRNRRDLERLPELGQGGLLERYRAANTRYAALTRQVADSAHAEGRPVDLYQQLEALQAEIQAIINAIRAVPGYAGFLGRLTAAQIQALARAAASPLVYLALTSAGTLALAVTPDHLEALWPELDEPALSALMVEQQGEDVTGGYLPAQLGNTHWLEASLAKALPLLGEKLLGPVAGHLRRLGAKSLTLIPAGRLGLLPLHAARYARDGQSLCLLDEFDVSYAPSAQALASAKDGLAKAKEKPGAVMAGVGSPLPHPKPLPYARAELEEIAPLFGREVCTLYEEAATKAALLAALPGANYWHFACHGSFNPAEPLQSALELGGPEPFTLHEILGLPTAHQARLAVLSACQTAITDFNHLPDEAIGLPAGFMQAGLPGVVGTLWSVNDLSTALLMVRFYTHHLKDGLKPAGALRQAQCWLRDVTNAELSESFDLYRQHSADRPRTRLSYETAHARFREYTLAAPDERPFASPYYWAPFVFYGL